MPCQLPLEEVDDRDQKYGRRTLKGTLFEGNFYTKTKFWVIYRTTHIFNLFLLDK